MFMFNVHIYHHLQNLQNYLLNYFAFLLSVSSVVYLKGKKTQFLKYLKIDLVSYLIFNRLELRK